jgi:hypothetical protein
MRRSVLLALGAALMLPSAASSTQPATGFAFGRLGGNIRPYRVTITNAGTVTASGPVVVRRRTLTRVQLGRLNFTAVQTKFNFIRETTSCKGTLPDVATSFIRVGARTVRVHGTCMPGFAKLWSALVHAVELQTA